MKITIEEANELATFPNEDNTDYTEANSIIEQTKKFDAKIQRLASKTQVKMKRIHNPYADLNREIGRMTSRDGFVRTH